MAVDVTKLLEKAREATDRRNYDYAIELYLQACTLSPDSATARKELRAVEVRVAKEKRPGMVDKSRAAMAVTQASMMMSMKKYDSVITKVEDALRLDPGNMSALMLLGRAAVAAGYKQAAICTFEHIKTMNADGNTKQLVEALRELANAYEVENRINEAMEVWNQIAKLAPGDREASLKARDLSAKTITSVIQNATKDGGPRGGVARLTQSDAQKKQAEQLNRQSGDIKSDDDLRLAIEDSKGELQQRPDDPRVHAKLGDLYRQGGNYDDAKKCYETAKQKDANNPMWTFKLHDLEIHRMIAGLKGLEAKVRAGDADARAQYQKDRVVLLEFRLNSFIEREKQYSTDSKIRFDLGNIYYELATAKGDRTLFDQAIQRFQKTFGDPKYRAESGLKMGLAFAAKNQYDLALKRFDEALGGMELKNEAWKNLTYYKADTLEKAGKKDAAKQTFLEIYEVDMSFKDVSKRYEVL